MNTQLDHLVIGAASLEQGVAYIKELLGVDIPKGGEHPLMGTHNHLMQLGNDVFLEVIAINPDAPAPTRPRWYGLDDPFVRRQFEQQPQLLTWVVNTSDLTHVLSQSSFAFGSATPVSRGDLHWHFAIPDDGRLLASGMVPSLMQWHTDTHPARSMGDVDCTLKRLEIHHPYPDWLAAILLSIDAAQYVDIKPLEENMAPLLLAHIETPVGVKVLSSQVGSLS